MTDRQYLARVASLGCAICRRMGYHDTPAEVHHERTGTGAGRRASHRRTCPLCPEHHRGNTGLHGMGRRAFERYHNVTEVELIEETERMIRVE